MEPTLRIVAAVLVFAGMVGTIWAMALQMKPGVKPKRLMIADPLCMMLGFALLLGIS